MPSTNEPLTVSLDLPLDEAVMSVQRIGDDVLYLSGGMVIDTPHTVAMFRDVDDVAVPELLAAMIDAGAVALHVSQAQQAASGIQAVLVQAQDQARTALDALNESLVGADSALSNSVGATIEAIVTTKLDALTKRFSTLFSPDEPDGIPARVRKQVTEDTTELGSRIGADTDRVHKALREDAAQLRRDIAVAMSTVRQDVAAQLGGDNGALQPLAQAMEKMQATLQHLQTTLELQQQQAAITATTSMKGKPFEARVLAAARSAVSATDVLEDTSSTPGINGRGKVGDIVLETTHGVIVIEAKADARRGVDACRTLGRQARDNRDASIAIIAVDDVAKVPDGSPLQVIDDNLYVVVVEDDPTPMQLVVAVAKAKMANDREMGTDSQVLHRISNRVSQAVDRLTAFRTIKGRITTITTAAQESHQQLEGLQSDLYSHLTEAINDLTSLTDGIDG